MRVSITSRLLVCCLALLASFTAAIPDPAAQGVTITFLDEHVGSFHLLFLYPTATAITANTCIDDITATLAALVDNVVDPSVFLAYSDADHTAQLAGDELLDDRAVLYVDVVHPDLTVVEGLSERKERRLLRLVEKIDAAIVDVVHRGQQQLLVAAETAEQLAEVTAAQDAQVQLLDARVAGLEKREGSDECTALETAEDAVAAAAVTANAQTRLTDELQDDIVEVQALLARILRDVAEVAAIVDEAETELQHRRRRHSHRGDEAAEEQQELAEATLIVRALTEVLELGVKAVAEAQDILGDGEAAVLLGQAVADAVEVAKCAVDDAERALRDVPARNKEDGNDGKQTDGTGKTENRTGVSDGTQQ